MTKLQTLASKLIGLIARVLMRIASLLLTRRAKLEFISSCLAWVLQKLNRHSLEVNHESVLGDLHFAINSQCLQLNFSFMEEIRRHTYKPGRNHESFRSGMRPRRKSNGDVISGNASEMAGDMASGTASDGANDKAHDVFNHIVGDILDSVIGEANDQAFDENGGQSYAARNRESVSLVGSNRADLLPCNCGRFS